jgi:thiol-disulfide isomerase/thioredoxin
MQIKAQTVQSLSFEELQNSILKAKLAQPIVVNFWATWCIPCVKELPYFEEYLSLNGEKYMQYLVSLDDPKTIQSRVIPFVQNKNLKSMVVLINESFKSEYFDSVHSEWSGSIPATLILLPSGENKFYEKAFSKLELFETLNQFIP